MVRLRKNKILNYIILSLILILVLTGCGTKSTNTNTNTNTNTQPQPVELVMGHPFSAQHPISQQILIPLAKELEEKSGGKIKLTIHAGGSVTSPATIREDVANGVIDIGWTLQGYTPGKYPVTDVIELPFMYDSTPQAAYVLWNLYLQSPDFQKEYGDVKILGLWVTDPGELLTKKPVKKPEDLSGMRIRFSGPAIESMIKKFGGTPVGMSMPEVYDALQRGVIDGVANGPSVIKSYKLNEVIKYATKGLNCFYSAQVIFMNKKKWESLSPEDQKLIESLTGEVIYKKATQLYADAYAEGLKLAQDSKIEINEITQEQREVWKEKTKDIVKEWLDKVNQKGIPGQQILDLVEKLKKEFNEKNK